MATIDDALMEYAQQTLDVVGDALRTLANEAGDDPFWNRGGDGYRALKRIERTQTGLEAPEDPFEAGSPDDELWDDADALEDEEEDGEEGAYDDEDDDLDEDDEDDVEDDEDEDDLFDSLDDEEDDDGDEPLDDE